MVRVSNFRSDLQSADQGVGGSSPGLCRNCDGYLDKKLYSSLSLSITGQLQSDLLGKT